MGEYVITGCIEVSIVADSHHVAPLRPQGPGHRITYAERCELLGTPDERLRIPRSNMNEQVGVLARNADRTDLGMVADELAHDRIGDGFSTGLRDHDRTRAEMDRVRVQALVLVQRRRITIIARRVDAMVMVTKSARVARKPRSVRPENHMSPRAPRHLDSLHAKKKKKKKRRTRTFARGLAQVRRPKAARRSIAHRPRAGFHVCNTPVLNGLL